MRVSGLQSDNGMMHKGSVGVRMWESMDDMEYSQHRWWREYWNFYILPIVLGHGDMFVVYYFLDASINYMFKHVVPVPFVGDFLAFFVMLLIFVLGYAKMHNVQISELAYAFSPTALQHLVTNNVVRMATVLIAIKFLLAAIFFNWLRLSETFENSDFFGGIILAAITEEIVYRIYVAPVVYKLWSRYPHPSTPPAYDHFMAFLFAVFISSIVYAIFAKRPEVYGLHSAYLVGMFFLEGIILVCVAVSTRSVILTYLMNASFKITMGWTFQPHWGGSLVYIVDLLASIVMASYIFYQVFSEEINKDTTVFIFDVRKQIERRRGKTESRLRIFSVIAAAVVIYIVIWIYFAAKLVSTVFGFFLRLAA